MQNPYNPVTEPSSYRWWNDKQTEATNEPWARNRILTNTPMKSEIAVKAAEPMTLKEAVVFLKYYNKWRLGKNCPQPEPKKITEALKIAIKILEPMTK